MKGIIRKSSFCLLMVILLVFSISMASAETLPPEHVANKIVTHGYFLVDEYIKEMPAFSCSFPNGIFDFTLLNDGKVSIAPVCMNNKIWRTIELSYENGSTTFIFLDGPILGEPGTQNSLAIASAKQNLANMLSSSMIVKKILKEEKILNLSSVKDFETFISIMYDSINISTLLSTYETTSEKCHDLTENQCKASRMPDGTILGENTSKQDLNTSKDEIKDEFIFAIDMLNDYKGNLQVAEKNGLFGQKHQIFKDYEDIISLIDSKISIFQNLKKQVDSSNDAVKIRDLRAAAREEWMEVVLLEKYAFLRLQPAMAIVGTKCSVDEILDKQVPYLSDHFNSYPLWSEFRQRALNNKSIYDLSKDGFVASWINSQEKWQEIWLNSPTGFCSTPVIPKNENLQLSVGAIKLYYKDFSLENLQARINSLLDAHADTDILVIPEYTYYSARFAGVDYKNDPVIINCESGLCSITSIGTQKSDMIKNAIESMQQIALTKKVSIVFGTVAERVVYEGYNFTVNSQVIINSNGEIIGTHKKYDIPYSNEVSCQTNQLDAAIICQQVRSQNLDTAIIFELIDKEGNSFTILPSICGEKFDSKYIEKVAGANAYLTVSSDFGGDPDYQNIMLEIQNGTNPFAFNDRGLLKIIREKWINNNVISSKSYLLVSDSVETGKTYPTAGIISWDLVTKIIDLDVTNDYVYGKINLEIKK